ncbi:MAG: ArsR family transcriptional regulator [Candidatus Heimdallarchaeota archaeon]|nr:ArsR family transcriptional regulator [Candidatus Heimdallarchaeota archaeon]
MTKFKEVKEFGMDFDGLAEILTAYTDTKMLETITALLEENIEFSELKAIAKLSKTALAHHLEKLVKLGIIKNSSQRKYNITLDGVSI